ncbi:MAG: hypothetical protein FWD84_00275 [Oscillospiraceae bacterium]|nr:hypothetical protein [Oscillospiraceae bacterium]
MSRFPRKSPWGDVQRCEQLIDGVFLVSTASHGGIMVRKSVAEFLSLEARKIGANKRNYLCFEIGCAEHIVMRELLDKKLWQFPDCVTERAKLEETINCSLQQRLPAYWESRQKRLPLSERLKDGAEKTAAHHAGTNRPTAKQSGRLEIG